MGNVPECVMKGFSIRLSFSNLCWSSNSRFSFVSDSLLGIHSSFAIFLAHHSSCPREAVTYWPIPAFPLPRFHTVEDRFLPTPSPLQLRRKGPLPDLRITCPQPKSR